MEESRSVLARRPFLVRSPDVDFWSLYIGGDTDFTDELSRPVRTPWEFVDRGQPLPVDE